MSTTRITCNRITDFFPRRNVEPRVQPPEIAYRAYNFGFDDPDPKVDFTGHEECYVLYVDDVAVSTAVVITNPKAWCPGLPLGYVLIVYTEKEARRRGYASQLLQHISQVTGLALCGGSITQGGSCLMAKLGMPEVCSTVNA